MKLNKQVKFFIFLSLFALFLSFLFGLPYKDILFSKEKQLDLMNGQLTVIAPLKGERKIKLILPNKKEYWLSCYGVENLCQSNNINSVLMVNNLKILYFEQPNHFINGIIVTYKNNNTLYKNTKFEIGKDDILMNVFLKNTFFALKLSIFCLMISIVLYFFQTLNLQSNRNTK